MNGFPPEPASAAGDVAQRAFAAAERDCFFYIFKRARALGDRVQNHVLRRARDGADGRRGLRVAPEPFKVNHDKISPFRFSFHTRIL